MICIMNNANDFLNELKKCKNKKNKKKSASSHYLLVIETSVPLFKSFFFLSSVLEPVGFTDFNYLYRLFHLNSLHWKKGRTIWLLELQGLKWLKWRHLYTLWYHSLKDLHLMQLTWLRIKVGRPPMISCLKLLQYYIVYI